MLNRRDVAVMEWATTTQEQLFPEYLHRNANGPVGSIWIDLTGPTYGIHGTPDPELIDKVGSHGCVRLTNWDAEELTGMEEPGVVVRFHQLKVSAP